METPEIKKRRVRYRGTHPRKFSEKYKELNPEKYAADIEKVVNRGQTPAGSHMPICVREIISILNPQPSQVGLDVTLGFGGHCLELLKLIMPNGRMVACDVDPIELPRTEARLRALGYGEDVFRVKRMNFAGIPQLLSLEPNGFDFILADLGVSSMQIDNPNRGFSFKTLGPLDLRLNPNSGTSAAALLQKISAEDLSALLTANADEPLAAKIARQICAARGKINTTHDLSKIIATALANLPSDIRAQTIKKTSQRVFQALRIAVNNEFGVLEQFLNLLPQCLKPSGKVAILSFHSGEDRRIKHAFKDGLAAGIYTEICEEPIRPSSAERYKNPRSQCAKLRWAVRAG